MFEQSVFNGVSGTLSIGMPLFKDVTDAADFNSKIAQTALVTTPPTPRTGGRVVLATSANTTVGAFAGLYAPENPGDRPNQGDTVRVCIYGEAIASAISLATQPAITIGSLLGIATNTTSCIALGATPAPRVVVGVVLATGTGLTNGSTPAGGGAALAVAILVNCFVSPT